MTTPDGPSAPKLTGMVRFAKITPPVGLLLLVGGATAVATGEIVLGAILLALAVACVGIGCAVLIVVWWRARTFLRQMQAREQAQRAQLERAIREYEQRHQRDQ